MRPYALVLTAEQRAELERTRARDPRPYLREMAAALLQVADGIPARRVARHGLGRRRKPETLYRWLARYAAGGLAALVHRRRGRRGFSPLAGGSAGRVGAAGPGVPRAGARPLAAR